MAALWGEGDTCVRASQARKQMVTMAGVSRPVGGPISRLDKSARGIVASRRYHSAFRLYCDGSQMAIIRYYSADLYADSDGFRWGWNGVFWNRVVKTRFMDEMKVFEVRIHCCASIQFNYAKMQRVSRHRISLYRKDLVYSLWLNWKKKKNEETRMERIIFVEKYSTPDELSVTVSCLNTCVRLEIGRNVTSWSILTMETT